MESKRDSIPLEEMLKSCWSGPMPKDSSRRQPKVVVGGRRLRLHHQLIGGA
jgi:hypothetical protein